MSENKTVDQSLEKIIMTRVMRLNAKLHGLVTGIILGLGVFGATNFLLIKGGETVGPHLSLLGQFFIGYRVTFVGSLVGLAYGFVTGFIAGYLVAVIYNWSLNWRDRKHSG